MPEHEVVVVTGASAGVGRAVVRRFAKEGAHLVLIARGAAGLEAARREVEEEGGKALVMQADAANAEAMEEAAARAEDVFGPIDIWINNAMTAVFAPVWEVSAEEYKRVTEVTYLGQVFGAMAALRRMRPRNRGVIVFVGSALAYRGIPLQSAYCGAKHGIQGFCESLRTELLHEGSNVHVGMVQLPAMNTPQFKWVKNRLPKKPQPVPPIFQPEVAADAIFWAAHRRRRELLVGGPTAVAVIGNKIAPSIADWYLARTGVSSQQTNEPADPGQPANLWQPVDDENDYGAHGDFGARSSEYSAQLWAAKHRTAMAAGAAAVCAGAILGSLWLRKKNDNRYV